MNRNKRRFKFVCEDCGKDTYFTTQEKGRAAILRCSACGSAYLTEKTDYGKEYTMMSFTAAKERKRIGFIK